MGKGMGKPPQSVSYISISFHLLSHYSWTRLPALPFLYGCFPCFVFLQWRIPEADLGQYQMNDQWWSSPPLAAHADFSQGGKTNLSRQAFACKNIVLETINSSR